MTIYRKEANNVFMTLRSYAPRSRTIATQTLSCSQENLSRSQIIYHAPKFWGDLPQKSPKIWEHDLINGSVMKKLLSCSHMFVMLQLFLSCSQIFYRKPTKKWEHDKKYWSMMNIWEHDAKNDILLQLVLSCSQFFHKKHTKKWEHDKKNWSMKKSWEHDLKKSISCSNIFYHAPKI